MWPHFAPTYPHDGSQKGKTKFVYVDGKLTEMDPDKPSAQYRAEGQSPAEARAADPRMQQSGCFASCGAGGCH
eukprot:gene8494-1520_t